MGGVNTCISLTNWWPTRGSLTNGCSVPLRNLRSCVAIGQRLGRVAVLVYTIEVSIAFG